LEDDDVGGVNDDIDAEIERVHGGAASTPTSSGWPPTPTSSSVDAHSETATLEDPDHPAVYSVMTDTRVEAVIDAIQGELKSCSQVCNISIQKHTNRKSILISAKLQPGPLSAHEVVDRTRQALSAVTTRLRTVSLLSARVQRDDTSYSLRTSLVCIPEGGEDSVCWDLFNKGYCPRRGQCQWYHPQVSDTVRMKVSIRCSDALNEAPSRSRKGV